MVFTSQFIIQFCFEIPLCTLHILMTIFLISMRQRRKSMYTSAYFLIQIFINFADLGNVINGFFSLKFSNIEALQSFYLNNTIFASLLYAISAYTAHFEVFGHTLIAYNRFAVFKDLNNSLWKDGKLPWIILGLALSPFISMGFRIPFVANFILTKNGQVAIVYIETKIQEYVSYSSIALFVSAFILTVLFSILAYLRYRVYKTLAHVRLSVVTREMKLLVHNCCMLACLTLRTVYQLTLLYATIFQKPTVTTTAQSFLPFISAFYSLSSSVFLLIISVHIRYDFLKFYGLKNFSSLTSKTSIATRDHLPLQTTPLSPGGYNSGSQPPKFLPTIS